MPAYDDYKLDTPPRFDAPDEVPIECPGCEAEVVPSWSGRCPMCDRVISQEPDYDHYEDD